MKSINSRTHPFIKQLTLLAHKKYRVQFKQFCAEGERTCRTLIESGMQLAALVATQAVLTKAQQLAAAHLITVVPDHVMEKISSAESPSGIVGVFAIPAAPDPSHLTSGLVLARLADPGNVGTLIRTAAALNVTNVVCIEGADPWSPKVVQASAGTIGMVKLFSWNWQDILTHKAQYRLCALVVEGGRAPSQLSLENTLLIVGSEAHGIEPAWLARCEEQVTLPMPGNTESLNAAVAGSIALYLAGHVPQ
jgi:TrmH family RNA methyltransferase